MKKLILAAALAIPTLGAVALASPASAITPGCPCGSPITPVRLPVVVVPAPKAPVIPVPKAPVIAPPKTTVTQFCFPAATCTVTSS